jgi:hypothetical protein
LVNNATTSPGVDGAAAMPVHSPEQLTPDWCSAALNAEVNEVNASAVGTGQMGACYRLELRGSADLPKTVLAKLPAAEAATREFLHGSYSTEVTFYRDVLPTVAVSAPEAYYAAISDDPSQRGTFTLLLEDLAPAKQGDQILGCTPGQALTAVTNVAGLHAPRWADETLLDISGLSLSGDADAELMDSLFGDAIGNVVTMLGKLIGNDDVKTLEEVAPYAGRWSMTHLDRFGLVHGDYRLDNLMFHDDGRLWAVDWQTLSLGLPARDVAFFLSSGLTVEDRRANERNLVTAYHARLRELGVDGYSMDQCLEDYRLALPQTLLIAVFGCAYSSVRTERGDRMFAAMIARGSQAIRDLNTLELLRDL